MTAHHDVEGLAAKLTEAQRALLLRYEATLDEQPITEAECFKGDCELFIELEPERYEHGCLIDPGNKAWFASTMAQSSEGSSTWDVCRLRYYPLGLALRSHLIGTGNG